MAIYDLTPASLPNLTPEPHSRASLAWIVHTANSRTRHTQAGTHRPGLERSQVGAISGRDDPSRRSADWIAWTVPCSAEESRVQVHTEKVRGLGSGGMVRSIRRSSTASASSAGVTVGRPNPASTHDLRSLRGRQRLFLLLWRAVRSP